MLYFPNGQGMHTSSNPIVVLVSFRSDVNLPGWHLRALFGAPTCLLFGACLYLHDNAWVWGSESRMPISEGAMPIPPTWLEGSSTIYAIWVYAIRVYLRVG
jgi:hypothetical protein